MYDARFEKLASLLVNYSVAVRRDDRVLLDLSEVPDEFAIALMRAVRKAKAEPFVSIKHGRVSRELILGSTKRSLQSLADTLLYEMKKMDAYIAVRGSQNVNETSDVPSATMELYAKMMRPVMNQRVNKTRWCVLRWPNAAMAQAAGMSTEGFEKFYFDVCTMDYARMGRAMQPLKRLMDRTDLVEIKGPGTDLRFSIKGIGAVLCKGDYNIPDGEVFSCPVKDSVEGEIQFNAPSVYAGVRFENVRLVFRKGKVVEATASDTKRLNQILNTDAGARYVGEFSLAFNPYILNPMGDILFDEKIAGSLHFTPGQAYELADNGNRSAVHWDMVLIQRPEWGGGEIYFDRKLIRKNGRFLPKELRSLNPEKLR